MTCITPRALALETIRLLKPLSCQAIAVASEAGTPLAAATDRTSEAPTRVAVGSGAAGGTTVAAGAGCAARGGVGAPVGSLIPVPASTQPLGSSPFLAAIPFADTRKLEAKPASVPPG